MTELSDRIYVFVLGALAMGCFVAAVFFARFYRDTRDPLFLYFAAAFAIEAINRTLLALEPMPNEAAPEFYLLRAFAYTIIVVGIVIKNRYQRP
jgi:hypothetical protein